MYELFEDAQTKVYGTVDESRCTECMQFYQDVFQFSDSSQIIPYIQKRTEYLRYIFRQLLMYSETTIDTCLAQYGKGEPTLPQVMGCIQALIADLIRQCQEAGTNRAECAIIQTLNDRAMEKALACGANQCTVSQFRERYKAEVNAMAQNLIACGEAFVKDDDLCVKMYARIMAAKQGAPTNASQTPDTTPVTQKEMKEKLGEMTAFVMMNG